MTPALLNGVRLAAQVGERQITSADVEDRVRRLRSGCLGACLPADGSAEARQLRRWLVQVLATEAIVEDAADSLGIRASGRSDLGHPAMARARMGSVVETVLATSGVARALFAVVTAGVSVDQAEVRAYYERNRDVFQRADKRIVVHEIDGQMVNAGRPIQVRRGELSGVVEAAVFGATIGSTVILTDESGRAHVVHLQQLLPGDVAPFQDVRDVIADQLLAAARARAFVAWVDHRRAALLWLAPGYEHPGDPSQPDSTHRH